MKAVSCTLVVMGAALVMALSTPTASALDVLIADDYFNGHLDFLVTALAGHTVTHLGNTDMGGSPVYTVNLDFMADFDVVIFYASADNNQGRQITTAEETALEAYIQGGGSLIVTGQDTLGSPDDPRLADVVRSSTYGDEMGIPSWTAASVNHFILNGPFGDYRGDTISPAPDDQDQLTPNAARGAVSLGSLDFSSFDKIVFTDVPAPAGSVGMWNGNEDADDWDATEPDGAKGLAILRNWLAGLADADGDGVFDADDNCPTTANSDQADGDGDSVGDVCDDCADTPQGAAVDASGCPTGCCGASGPVSPLALAVGLLLLSRFAGYRSMRRLG